MPPRRLSRYTFSLGVNDSLGNLYLTDREPFGFQDRPDNVQHVVLAGESLYTLAGRYFNSIPRAAGLWWVIADFQPDPILDPTIQLTEGSLLVVPSLRTVLEEVFAETRRDEFEL